MFSCWFLFGEPFVRCQTKEGKLTKLAVPCCCVFPSILFVANHLFSILFRILLLALCLLCSLENAFESFTSDQLRRIILKKKFSGRHPRSLPMDEVGNVRRLICIFDCVRRGGGNRSVRQSGQIRRNGEAAERKMKRRSGHYLAPFCFRLITSSDSVWVHLASVNRYSGLIGRT